MEIFEEFNARRHEGNAFVSEQNFLPFNRFFALDKTAFSEGEIPPKYKELMGLACSLLFRCNDCVLYHIRECYKLECTRQELNETMNISLIIGGTIVIPHLRFALKAINEIYSSDE